MRNVLAIFLALTVGVEALAQCRATLVMEPQTGKILHEENGDQPFPTASMTKMMTLLVVIEEIEDGRLEWDARVRTSAKASRMGGSQVYLKHDELFTVREMVEATMVHSANDAAMALAEHVAGTEEGFVELMNRRAEELGLENTTYVTPHGLPDPARPDDTMSPRDLAVLGSEVMKHPELRRLAAIDKMPFRDGTFTLYNPNHLIGSYPGATGIKTGYHNGAGFCVTASARKGALELIAVSMGCGKKESFDTAAALMSRYFNAYRMLLPVREGMELEKPLRVRDGANAAVPVKAGASFPVLADRRTDPTLALVVSSIGVAAPIREGQQIGWILVEQDGKPVGKVPALAAASVDRASWFSRTWDKVWPF
ncbi:MAG TPA: D-alanyl-D-alanine carboxypeptidase family protein [Thermoanaerobaculia bacterium]|nr:D-alanyl-D-alanine carboxypeptidase family protein [Thermoanaerobaculia bacterium]